MIQISNCPDTNLERFITHKNLFFYETTKQVILECHITHYKDGVVIENERIKSYKRNLVATESTPVNPLTGQEVESFEIEAAISEYQFFDNLRNVAIKQNEMQLQIIEARDSQGKFNI